MSSHINDFKSIWDDAHHCELDASMLMVRILIIKE